MIENPVISTWHGVSVVHAQYNNDHLIVDDTVGRWLQDLSRYLGESSISYTEQARHYSQ